MNDYELMPGLIDAAVYIAPVLVGALLWFVGWKRRPRGGSSFLMGLGIVFVVIFGVASIQPISDAFEGANPSSASVDQADAYTTTSASATTTTQMTTTSTTRAALYRVPEQRDSRAWATEALAYAEGVGWKWDDRSAASYRAYRWAQDTCYQLTAMDSSLLVGPESVAQTEAEARENYTMEQWEVFGAVWFDSLVHGLCVDR